MPSERISWIGPFDLSGSSFCPENGARTCLALFFLRDGARQPCMESLLQAARPETFQRSLRVYSRMSLDMAERIFRGRRPASGL